MYAQTHQHEVRRLLRFVFGMLVDGATCGWGGA
jgi:hypothetical protein